MDSEIFSQTSWWLITCGVSVVVFLMMLNGFLRGRYTPHVDVVLGFLWIALIVLTIFLFDWLVAILYVAATFIFGALTKSVAARVAAKSRKTS